MKRVKRLHGKALTGLSALLFALLLITPQLVMALTANTLGDYDDVTVMEVSGSYDVGYLPDGNPDMSARRSIAQEFYRTHGDEYDFLVIFTNFDFIMPPGAKAFFSPARNNVEGIGLDTSDDTNLYSFDGSYLDRLEGTIDMGYIANQSLEPTDSEFDGTLLALSHEMAHRWSAYVEFDDGGSPSNALLGLDDSHWSFLLDSDGSTLYGNNWQDNGDGTFTSIAPEQGQDNSSIGRLFSPLDLYLMGLIDKSQVPPMTLIETADTVRERIPEVGVTITGTAKTVTIDDIIAIEGDRLPNAAEARKDFRTAFIYAVAPGTWTDTNPQSRGEVLSINRLQTEWEKRFSILTDGAAIVRTDFVVDEVVDTNPGVTAPITSAHIAPHVNEGVNWLVNNQLGDGSWQDLPGTAQRDTATAVAALKQFPAGSVSASSGQAWLGGVTSENSDFLARKLLGLDSVSLTEIESLQNADGGWGSAAGYRSNPVDTALALKALTTQGSANTAVLDAAITYLHNSQNPDGGWNTGLGLSMVQPTAYALLALNDYRDNPSYTLEPAVADGSAWLEAKQNIDGGFGNSPSTVYDTSVALDALKTVGSSQTVTDGAINYLLTTQDDSGSWNDSAFQTAMAVDALYAGQVAVDLYIDASDISFNPPVLNSVPADVTVSANVHNLGSTATSQVTVALYDNDPVSGTLVEEKLVDLPGNSTVSVDFTTSISDYGQKNYYVVLDGNDQVEESTEFNNTAVNTLNVNMPAPTVGFDLASSSGAENETNVAITVSLSYPWSEVITIDYSVNEASTAIPASDYQLTDGTLTFAANQTIQTINIPVANDGIAEIDKAIIIDLATPSQGTLGTSQHTYTILDDELPVVTISSPTSGTIGTDTTQLIFSTTGSSVEVDVDGNVVNKVSGDTLDPLAEGLHYVEVTATNGLGLSNNARVDFTVDVVMITILSPKGLVTESAPLLDYSIDGPVSNIVKMIDGVVINTLSGQNLAPLADGSHTLEITANAYGTPISASEAFTIDTQPHTIKLKYPYENGVLEEATPTLLYDVNGSGTVTVTVDGVDVTKVSGETLDALTDGEHTVQVAIADAFGVRDSDEATFIVELDMEQPLVSDTSWPAPSRSLWRRSDVAVDKVGNVYMAGMTSSGYDLSVTKYNKNGVLLWTRTPWVVNMETDANALAVDAAGNAYVAFTSFDGIGGFTAKAGRDVYLAKFSTNGGSITGLVQIASNYDDYAYDIFVSEDGFIYVSGLTGGSLFSGSSGGISTWVAKYDSNLNRQWGYQRSHATYTDPGNCFVTVDADGFVYVAGNTTGQFGGSGTTGGYYLAKWNSNGAYYGAIQTGSGMGIKIAGLGADAFGDVYLLGTTTGAFAGYTNAGSNDVFIVKHTAGNPLAWVRQWGTADIDEANGLVVEPDGNLYLLEQHDITKYDRNGNHIWTDTKLSANRFEEGGIAIDDSGNLYAIYDASSSDIIYKYMDTRLPDITLNAPSLTNQPSILISGSMEAEASVSVTTDTAASCSGMQYSTTTTWSCSLDNLQEGTNNITVMAKNADGFKSYVYSKVTLDTIPPNINIYVPLEGVTYSDKPTPSYSAYTATSVKGYLNDIEINALDLPLQGLKPGQNVFRLDVTDAAGNSNSKEVSFGAIGNAVGEAIYETGPISQFGTSSTEEVDQVVIDSNDNIYLVGTTFGDLNGEPNNGLSDVFVSKYDSSGNALWTRLYGSGDSEYGKGLAVDNLGNIYLLWEVHYSSVKGNSQDWTDVLLAKYDSNNTLLWTQTVSSKARDYAGGIDLDVNGNVWVAGTTEGSLDRRELVGVSDYYLVEFDNNGNQLWLYTSMMAGDDAINDISCDSSDGVYLTGKNGNGEPYIAKFLTSGTEVNFYNTIYSSPIAGEVRALQTVIGQTYLTGYVDKGQGNQKDIFFAKCSSGNCATQEFGSAGNDVGQALAMDTEGNLYVAGYVEGPLFGQLWEGGKDVLLTKMNPDGQRLWTALLGTTTDDQATGVVVAADGSLFVGGQTSGDLGGTNSGESDAFLVQMSKPQGPVITVDPVTSPTNIIDQLITGTTSPGATVTVNIDEPVGSTAVVSPVTQNPDGTWAFTVSGMVPNANNVFTVIASDQSGSASETVTVVVDTIISLTAYSTTPTNSNTQEIYGITEAEAVLMIEVNPPSTPIQVTAASNGSWNCTISLEEGDNIVVVTSTDLAGNQAVKTVNIRYDAMIAALSRPSIYRDESDSVVLTINNLTDSEQVSIEQFYDVNNNGIIDSGDQIVRQFYLREGSYSGDYNVPSDESPSVPGILTTLNYHYINDILHATGRHLFRVKSQFSEKVLSLDVLPSSYQQSISGVVLDEFAGVVPGAVIRVVDKWGRPIAYGFSDNNGSYSLAIEKPGEYELIPAAFGYVYDKSSSALISLGSSEAVNRNINIATAGNLISGILHDGPTNFSDVLLRAESNNYVGFARSDLQGNYEIYLPDGDYDFYVDNFISSSTQRVYSYVPETSVFGLNVTNTISGNDIELQRHTLSCQMKLYDEFGIEKSGIPIKNSIDDGSSSVVFSTSDEAGFYNIARNFTDISLNDKLAQSIGYVGTTVTYTPNNCWFNSGDIIVYPIDSWITGSVKDSLGQPVKGVPVKLSDSASGVVVEGFTIGDGTYYLGSIPGSMDVEISPEVLGYNVVPPQSIELISDQITTLDFVITMPAPEPDLAITSFSATLISDDTQIDMPITIMNQGDADIDVDVALDFYLSQDTILSTSTDTLICSTTLPWLAASQTYSTTQTCSFPSSNPDTTYTVFAVVDGPDNLVESNEGNNQSQDQVTTAPLLTNTIVITNATYTQNRNILDVDASSDHPDADLKVEYGGNILPMTFQRLSKGKYLWDYKGNINGTYVNVTVFGPEGSVTVPTTVK